MAASPANFRRDGSDGGGGGGGGDGPLSARLFEAERKRRLDQHDASVTAAAAEAAQRRAQAGAGILIVIYGPICLFPLSFFFNHTHIITSLCF